ncbi:MAG: hypothetical protein WA740_09485 [Candidatus Binataceae bacterium]
MAELFSLVKIRKSFKIVSMEEPTPSGPVSPADQSPAPAPESALQPAQEPAEDAYVSARKLAANRRNSSRSTGPRTARGKRRASLNALKHGMFAKELVLPALEGKNAAAEFRALLHALTSDLAPRGAFELVLVEEIAVCTWRMRRLLRFENRTAFLNSNDWKEPPSRLTRGLAALASMRAGSTEAEEAIRYGYIDKRDRILAETGLNEMSLGDPDEVQMIREFENALMRHIFRSITMLKCLQADAASEPHRPSARFRRPRNLEQTRSSDRIIQQDQGM